MCVLRGVIEEHWRERGGGRQAPERGIWAITFLCKEWEKSDIGGEEVKDSHTSTAIGYTRTRYDWIRASQRARCHCLDAQGGQWLHHWPSAENPRVSTNITEHQDVDPSHCDVGLHYYIFILPLSPILLRSHLQTNHLHITYSRSVHYTHIIFVSVHCNWCNTNTELFDFYLNKFSLSRSNKKYSVYQKDFFLEGRWHVCPLIWKLGAVFKLALWMLRDRGFCNATAEVVITEEEIPPLCQFDMRCHHSLIWTAPLFFFS